MNTLLRKVNGIRKPSGNLQTLNDVLSRYKGTRTLTSNFINIKKKLVLFEFYITNVGNNFYIIKTSLNSKRE